MIKAVIFDIGNVLIRWSAPAQHAYLMQALGLTDEQFTTFSKNYLYRLGTGEITEEQLWAKAKSDFGIRDVDVSENLLGHLLEAQGTVYHNVIAFAKQLEQRGFIVALLSDSILPHEQILAAKGVTTPFDHVFFSQHIGFRKPNPKAYQYALDHLNITASEALFIDDLPENVAGAQKVGMHAIIAGDPGQIPEQIERELEKDFTGTKVALIHDDSVLTILRDDVPNISFPDHWDLPGGAREHSETPHQVAIREVYEELGITLSPDDFIWQKFYPAVADPRLTGCFLVSPLTDAQLANITFGDEGQKWQLMTFQEFLHHPKAVDGMKLRLRDYLAATR